MILTAQIFFSKEQLKNDVSVQIFIKAYAECLFWSKEKKLTIYHRLFDIWHDKEHTKITGDIPWIATNYFLFWQLWIKKFNFAYFQLSKCFEQQKGFHVNLQPILILELFYNWSYIFSMNKHWWFSTCWN